MLRVVLGLLIFSLILSVTVLSFAQEETEEMATKQTEVEGVIKEIAQDSSYIIVGDTKIITTQEFLEDSYLEVGDKVKVTVEETAQGLEAVSYEYIFDDESPEDSLSEEYPEEAY